jgi:aconitate hydratase
MGVLPLDFESCEGAAELGLDGTEVFDITGLAAGLKPRMDVTLRIIRAGGTQEVPLICRIDTLDEIEYFKNGGILPFVLRNLMKAA